MKKIWNINNMVSRNGNQLEEYFVAAFGSMAGIIVFMTIIAIYTLVWAGTGIMLLYKYNKKDTPLLKEMNYQQIIGIVLIVIGILPFLQYLIQSILFRVGWELGGNLMNDLMDN